MTHHHRHDLGVGQLVSLILVNDGHAGSAQLALGLQGNQAAAGRFIDLYLYDTVVRRHNGKVIYVGVDHLSVRVEVKAVKVVVGNIVQVKLQDLVQAQILPGRGLPAAALSGLFTVEAFRIGRYGVNAVLVQNQSLGGTVTGMDRLVRVLIAGVAQLALIVLAPIPDIVIVLHRSGVGAAHGQSQGILKDQRAVGTFALTLIQHRGLAGIVDGILNGIRSSQLAVFVGTP